jgi:uncharacterized protein YndB with AHSA1/START domain
LIPLELIMAATDSATKAPERELVLSRIIDAPREKVYKAWTDPGLLKQWFVPHPWTKPFAEMDVRPGDRA